ncbi:hypothetical protein HDE_10690 [Halotydeus destructor]|nr:hypothetical protein HDE_10690 [Halotydeus destructor]
MVAENLDYFYVVLSITSSIFIITANSLVVRAVTKTKGLRTASLIFVANQSFSDIIYATCEILQFVFCLDQVVRWSDITLVICELNFVAIAAAFTISAWFLFFAVLDIFRSIYFPFSQPIKPVVYVVILWMAAVTNTFFAFVGIDIATFFAESHFNDCFHAFDGLFEYTHNYQNAATKFHGIYSGIVPFTGLLILAIAIMKKLSEKTIGETSDRQEEKAVQRKRKVAKMFLYMIAVYLAFTLPITVTFTLDDRGSRNCHAGEGLPWTLRLPLLLNKFSCISNFIILCTFNRHVRAEASKIFATCIRLVPDHVATTSTAMQPSNLKPNL